MLNRAPPAVAVYQRLAQYWPNRELWDDIGLPVLVLSSDKVDLARVTDQAGSPGSPCHQKV
jgi:hypothetical protein